jgi:hypothetical protein
MPSTKKRLGSRHCQAQPLKVRLRVFTPENWHHQERDCQCRRPHLPRTLLQNTDHLTQLLLPIRFKYSHKTSPALDLIWACEMEPPKPIWFWTRTTTMLPINTWNIAAMKIPRLTKVHGAASHRHQWWRHNRSHSHGEGRAGKQAQGYTYLKLRMV